MDESICGYKRTRPFHSHSTAIVAITDSDFCIAQGRDSRCNDENRRDRELPASRFDYRTCRVRLRNRSRSFVSRCRPGKSSFGELLLNGIVGSKLESQ